MYLAGEGPSERVCWRRSVGEGPSKRVRWRRFIGEGPSEKFRWRRSIGEGLTQKICKRGFVRESERVRWRRSDGEDSHDHLSELRSSKSHWEISLAVKSRFDGIGSLRDET